MKNILKQFILSLIIIITYWIIYLLTQNQISGSINFIVMLILVLITDKYYLIRIGENNLKFICKSFISVFILSVISFFIYNAIQNRLTYTAMDLIPIIIIIFLVLGTLIIYIIFYGIAKFINKYINY